MSLSTINFRDGMKTTTKNITTNRVISQNMDTTDIIGASPKLHGSKVVNKPEFSNQNWDIERSCPRSLHIGLNKPENNLGNRDIEQSVPKCAKFNTKRIGGDPMNPKYKLQSYEERPITPPRFMRDTLHHDDIDGSKPKKATFSNIQTREVNKIDDIEGTKAKFRHQERVNSNNYSSFDYSDITKDKFMTKRQTNPLQPSYVGQDENGKQIEYGVVEGSKPQPQAREIKDPWRAGNASLST